MVSRMVRGKLSQAWGRWRESHAELARQRRVLGRAMGRMSRGRESAAFNKWVEHVVEAVRQRCIAGKETAHRMLRNSLRRLLDWRTAVYVAEVTSPGAILHTSARVCLNFKWLAPCAFKERVRG